MKLKSLVIVNHDVTVNIYQTLHTPPITLKECAYKELHVTLSGTKSQPQLCAVGQSSAGKFFCGGGIDLWVGDLSEVDTR